MSTIRKKDIEYGKKNLLSEDEFNPEYGKERITILIDQQVVDAFRTRAKKEGAKYQTLIREALKEYIFGNDFEERLRKIEDKVFKRKRA